MLNRLLGILANVVRCFKGYICIGGIAMLKVICMRICCSEWMLCQKLLGSIRYNIFAFSTSPFLITAINRLNHLPIAANRSPLWCITDGAAIKPYQIDMGTVRRRRRDMCSSRSLNAKLWNAQLKTPSPDGRRENCIDRRPTIVPSSIAHTFNYNHWQTHSHKRR